LSLSINTFQTYTSYYYNVVSYSASIFTSVYKFTRVYSEYSRTLYHYVYKVTCMYNKHISI